ncbi:NAD-dependent malic enzyme 62 kDa isoform, mitochondrial [Vitis vinifera]|uniref:NAD-dependent malic enzyme 62 kDa isoform, mitochondrial n=1 Tax=Vitis vinifera TaxID=29760 RepID=A0A438J015_VITVI|nr:NAD-dependent malic enzyme 62 kDa isoform, mitochondrial [Vitis vinifera]
MSNFCRQIKLSSSLIRRLKHRSSNSMLSGRRSFTTTEGHRPSLVHKRSLDILHDPWFNKVILLSMHFNFVPFCLICSLVVVEKSCDRYQLDSWMLWSGWRGTLEWLKGTAFSMTERDRLDLRGLLPPTVMSPEMQIERFRILGEAYVSQVLVVPSKASDFLPVFKQIN